MYTFVSISHNSIFLLFSSEMYHAVRWHNEFAAPMTTLADRLCLFVNDFLSFKDPDLGIVTGKLYTEVFSESNTCKSLFNDCNDCVHFLHSLGSKLYCALGS